jgi:hypothetical protein
LRNRFIVTARADAGPTDIDVGLRRKRIQFLRAFDLGQPFIETLARDQQPAVIVMSARLRLNEAPRAKLGRYGTLDPPVSFGVSFRGKPFFIVEWSLEPGAVLPPHCHPNVSVCTLGLEGEARIRNFEIVGDAPDFSSKQAFQIRETHNEIIAPGRLNTLSAFRDNIHTFQAGKQGARGIDISTYHGPDVGFSFLDIGDRARDAKRRIYEAAWKKL